MYNTFYSQHAKGTVSHAAIGSRRPTILPIVPTTPEELRAAGLDKQPVLAIN